MKQFNILKQLLGVMGGSIASLVNVLTFLEFIYKLVNFFLMYNINVYWW